CIEHILVIVIIIKRPVARLLFDEVYSLLGLVIPHRVLLTVVRKLICSTRNVWHRDVRQYPDGRSSKSRRWNCCVRKHALSRAGATFYVVRLSIVKRISQSSRGRLPPKRSVHTPVQGIAV